MTEIQPSVERPETSANKPPDRRGRSIAVPARDAQIAVGTAPYFPTSGFERTAYTAYAIAVTTTAMGPVSVTKERVDRKSTRLNSSHVAISYAVFCLKKKIKDNTRTQY